MRENEVSATADTLDITEGVDIPIGYKLNVDTGELVELSYSEPIDTKKMVCRDSYNQEILRVRGKKKWRVGLGQLVLDLVIDRLLSIPALSLFCAMGREVGYHNVVMITNKEMREKTSYSRQTISNCIQELKREGLIKEAEWSIKGKEDRLFFLNPLYFYMGYYPYRDALLKQWWEETSISGREDE